MAKLLTLEEVSKHNKRDDCWVIIHNKVYDLTNFLSEHPGGAQIILKNSGKDATIEFGKIHSIDILATLPQECFIGNFDLSTAKKEVRLRLREFSKTFEFHLESNTALQSENISATTKPSKPSIDAMLNVFDFEAIAKEQMDSSGWAYYSSGADDEVSLRENHAAFARLFLRPRVLVDVSTIDTSCTLLGTKSAFPLYITATALGKLADPEGEVVLTRAAAKTGIIQMIPTLASCSLDEMVDARAPGQNQWFQLYVNRNRQATKELVQKVEKLGCKALCITVDAPVLGKREKDMRQKFNAQLPDAMSDDTNTKKNQGTARAISTFIDPSLKWDDIKWFQSITNMPIVIKGIQTGEDAILAVRHNVQGIIISNHGGRQLDYARSAVEVLVEVMAALKAIGAEKEIEVYVDGGIRRGTDIFKCLALGAKAVGIGRPALYGLASYGEAGVLRVLDILKDELEMSMRLMGTPTVDSIKPEMVATRNIADHTALVPSDSLFNTVYQNMTPYSRL